MFVPLYEMKLFMCFVDMKNDFYARHRKVMEWVMQKKIMPKPVICAVMSLHEVEKAWSKFCAVGRV